MARTVTLGKIANQISDKGRPSTHSWVIILDDALIELVKLLYRDQAPSEQMQPVDSFLMTPW